MFRLGPWPCECHFSFRAVRSPEKPKVVQSLENAGKRKILQTITPRFPIVLEGSPTWQRRSHIADMLALPPRSHFENPGRRRTLGGVLLPGSSLTKRGRKARSRLASDVPFHAGVLLEVLVRIDVHVSVHRVGEHHL